MTINKCARGTTGLCRENEQKFIEPMHCKRFNDDKDGPWYMISQAVEHDTCGAVTVKIICYFHNGIQSLNYNNSQGKYNLSGAKMRPEYLDPFIAPVDSQMSRYRIEMLFHKPGASVESERKHVRGCVDLEFELVF